jgi:ribosomal protein S18 acetylase RimI-like enzyme
MIKPLDETHRAWAIELIRREWASPQIITRGKIHDCKKLPGFIFLEDDKPIGLLLYVIDHNECEIISLNSLLQKRGVGSSLIQEVKNDAKAAGCSRVWTITTNDNLEALHFYQKRGLTLVAVYPNALAKSRILKPELPMIGKDGIPLRDEIELELLL